MSCSLSHVQWQQEQDGNEEEVIGGQGRIDKLCHLDKLWNEGEEHSLEETWERCGHTEGKWEKRPDRMRREEEMIKWERSRWSWMN